MMKKWEISLLFALVVTLCWGAWSIQKQEDLSRKMIRLHVIANSDSEEDQALKLQVRDRILSFTEEQLQASSDIMDAQKRLNETLPVLKRLAAEEIGAEGYDYPVKASLAYTYFPLKEYDCFSLPSGRYLALRIIIGEGAGHNWWCVVYPPLCTAASELKDVAAEAGLSDADISLITEENEGYVLKFRSVELWQKLMAWLRKS